MKSRKMALQVLVFMILAFGLVVPALAAGASVKVHWPDAPSISHLAVDSWSDTSPMTLNKPQGQVTLIVAADTTASAEKYPSPEFEVGDWRNITQAAAGAGHTVGLKADGTVVAVGYNNYRQCNVGGWRNVIQVAAGFAHTVGLKSDGTVVAVGGQYHVSGWKNITQVAAGDGHIVGLKADGTVVAVGENYLGQCNVGNWTDIMQVDATHGCTVGLRSDGTVVAVGYNAYGQCNVGNWTNIIQVAAGYDHIVGLKADGTVVAVGSNAHGQCNVGNWTDIMQVDASECYTVGLKSDGTAVAVGWNYYGQCNVGNWTDIMQVAAGYWHTAAVKSDGTVVAVGYYSLQLLPTWCFIATAAYGTPMAREIEILREFRDEYLLSNPVGQALVGLYYRASPPMAEFITKHPSLKPVVRAGLVPAVAMSAIAVNTTPAEKIAILGLVVLVAVALSIRTTRRRGRSPVSKM